MRLPFSHRPATPGSIPRPMAGGYRLAAALMLGLALACPAPPSRGIESPAEGRKAPPPGAPASTWANRASAFGINGHLPSREDFERMRRGGIRWARIDLTWDVIEPEPGKYRWDVVDRVVADAEANGVNLLGILGYCPTWAASGPSPFFPPWDVAHWKEFVRTIVGRYKGRIRHWTLWNEPNSESFFRGTLDQYINVVLLPGAKAAKEADPDCRIVGPDLAHLSGADWDKWLDKILARAGGAFDVIGHHCYKGKPDDVLRELDGRKKPWEAPSVRQILEKRGAAGKPFWLTETGWRSTQVGEQKQAGYIVALLRGIAARSWIDKVFLFELRDSPSLPGYGLLRTDGTPKPAFEAYKGFIEAAE